MQNNFKKFQKVPLITSLVFLLLSFSVFVFLYQKTGGNDEDSKRIGAELEQETTKRDEIKSLDRALSAVETERALLDTHFVESSDVVSFLDTIERLATGVNTKAEVTLINISPDNTSLSVGVAVSGSFESIYKFLKLLENSAYQLEFNSMDIHRTDGGVSVAGASESSAWLGSFTIKVLSFVK